VAKLPKIGPYLVKRELARGAMGVVYVASHEVLGRDVALKVLQGTAAGERALRRFATEAEALAKLQHPNVVALHEVGTARGMPFLVMDLIEGESLEETIERAPLSSKEAARVCEGLARGLQHAHERGVLHRDVKPANVLIAKDGRPLLTDFGLAFQRAILDDESERLTRSGQLLGTPHFMAPEQARGALDQIDARTDVYSLGATLFSALTGRPVFDATSLPGLIHCVTEVSPRSPASYVTDVDRELAAICLKCLEKDRDLRYASAGALADDLARLLRNEPVHASRSDLKVRARKWASRQSKIVWGLGALAPVILVGAGVYLVVLRPRQEAEAILHEEDAYGTSVLLPYAYGTAPQPEGLSVAELRRRLTRLERVAGTLPTDPRLRRARTLFGAHVRLLEHRRGEKVRVPPPSAGRPVPALAVDALVLAERGDLEGSLKRLARAQQEAEQGGLGAQSEALERIRLRVLAERRPTEFFATPWAKLAPALQGLARRLGPEALEAQWRFLISPRFNQPPAALHLAAKAAAEEAEAWGLETQACALAKARVLKSLAPSWEQARPETPLLARRRAEALEAFVRAAPTAELPAALRAALERHRARLSEPSQAPVRAVLGRVLGAEPEKR